MSPWQSHSTTNLDPVVKKVTTGLATLARENFLSTLLFDQIYDRFDAVPEPHVLTYRWALQHDARRDKQWDDLAAWLEFPNPESNIYWVTGQPGCGKSTLMKFLATSPTTEQ